MVFAVLSSSALAHGNWPPKHGGQMNDGETSFELVLRSGHAAIYVSDHGEAVAVAGANGTLEIESATGRRTVPLTVTGKSRLHAALPAAVKRGDRVVVRVALANGSVAVGRFVAD